MPGPTDQRLAKIKCVHLHHLETERLYNIPWADPSKLTTSIARNHGHLGIISVNYLRVQLRRIEWQALRC